MSRHFAQSLEQPVAIRLERPGKAPERLLQMHNPPAPTIRAVPLPGRSSPGGADERARAGARTVDRLRIQVCRAPNTLGRTQMPAERNGGSRPASFAAGRERLTRSLPGGRSPDCPREANALK